jgi:hypothetical protein
MYTPLFNEFLASDDTLQVYKDGELIFSSDEDRLLPLLEYISRFASNQQQVVVFDKIMGNAAALLSVKADCQEVYSPLGSEIAVKTLETYSINYQINEIVPYIRQADSEDMCPMEKLSLDKSPEEFYEAVIYT